MHIPQAKQLIDSYRRDGSSDNPSLYSTFQQQQPRHTGGGHHSHAHHPNVPTFQLRDPYGGGTGSVVPYSEPALQQNIPLHPGQPIPPYNRPGIGAPRFPLDTGPLLQNTPPRSPLPISPNGPLGIPPNRPGIGAPRLPLDTGPLLQNTPQSPLPIPSNTPLGIPPNRNPVVPQDTRPLLQNPPQNQLHLGQPLLPQNGLINPEVYNGLPPLNSGQPVQSRRPQPLDLYNHQRYLYNNQHFPDYQSFYPYDNSLEGRYPGSDLRNFQQDVEYYNRVADTSGVRQGESQIKGKNALFDEDYDNSLSVVLPLLASSNRNKGHSLSSSNVVGYLAIIVTVLQKFIY